MSSPPKAYVYIENTSGNGTRGGAVMDTKLAAQGWNVTTHIRTTGVPAPTLQSLKDGGYTFFGVDASFWGVGNVELNTAYQAYNAGLNVMTLGNDTTWSTGNPIWTGSANTTKVYSPITPNTASGHPVANGWTAFNDTDVLTHQTGIRASAVTVAHFDHDTLGLLPAVFAETNPNGNAARYIHSQAYAIPDALWTSAGNWLAKPGGMARYWNGTAWVWKSASVWNGTAWIKRPVKQYSGGVWTTV